MFKMRLQIPNKPVYSPPIPNIQMKPREPLANPIVMGGIYQAMYNRGPCTSCGNR